MKPTQFFPTVMIVLAVGAAITYAYAGIHNWRMILYWIAAAVLNFVVTY